MNDSDKAWLEGLRDRPDTDLIRDGLIALVDGEVAEVGRLEQEKVDIYTEMNGAVGEQLARAEAAEASAAQERERADTLEGRVLDLESQIGHTTPVPSAPSGEEENRG